MPFSDLLKSSSFSKEVAWYLEGSCKAPTAMKIEPALPPGYTAWVHRAGWILYVHDASKTASWMHPVKLANFEARGLKGPGKIGPEMFIWEPNVNRRGHYVIDYGYPPMGRPRSGERPVPLDFQDIDRMGFAAWKAKEAAELAAHAKESYEKLEQDIMPDHVGSPRPGWADAYRKAMLDQGIESIHNTTEEEENDTKIGQGEN